MTSRNRRVVPLTTIAALFAVSIGVGGASLASTTPVTVSATVPAPTIATTVVKEDFQGTHTTSGDWYLPSPTASTDDLNTACLTHGASGAAAPVPQCDDLYAGTAPPYSTSSLPGLQLTPPTGELEGGVGYGVSVPTTAPIDVKFDSFQYGGNQADGLALFFAASNPDTPTMATHVDLGYRGGGLGYASNAIADAPGMPNGYLGIGLDAFGNFAGSESDGAHCSPAPLDVVADTVAVRGPGSVREGYCLLNSLQADGLHGDDTTPVPVEVALNPTSAPITTPEGLDVAAGGYAVAFTPVGGTRQTLSGSLPNASSYLPVGWADANGLPKRLSFGWSGATGGADEFTVVRNTQISTLVPAHLSFGTTQPVDTRVSQPMSVAVSVRRDSDNTVVDSYTGDVTLALSGGTSGAHFDDGSGPVTVLTAAAVHGVAAFAPTVDTTGAGYTLTATTGRLTAKNSDPFNIYSATHLVYTTQPVNDEVNAPMRAAGVATPLTVQVKALNADESVDPNYYGPVTLTLTGGNAGATFVGAATPPPPATLTASAVAGVANFSPVAIDTTGIGYTLAAASRDLTSATSDSFVVSPRATQLKFQTQPVDTGVNQPMRSPGSSTDTPITVKAFGSDGTTLAAYYDGLVVLSLTGGSSGARFVTDTSTNPATTSPTLTLRAVNGVVTFSPIIINKTGFNYQLNAASTPVTYPTAPLTPAATSTKFLVAGDAKVCQSGATACPDVTPPGATNGDAAKIKGTPPTNGAVLITGTFGANVDRLSCSSAASSGILTFTGAGKKFITVVIPASVVSKGAISKFCYAQPSPFLMSSFKPAPLKSNNGGEYEGLLPPCAPQPKDVPPCVLSITWKKGQPETAVIESATSDPHLAH